MFFFFSRNNFAVVEIRKSYHQAFGAIAGRIVRGTLDLTGSRQGTRLAVT